MICGKCNTENADVAVYCKKCGYRLDGKVKCPSCGSYTAEGKFCNFCGRQLPGTVRCKYCGSVIYDSFVKSEYAGEPKNKTEDNLEGDVTLGAVDADSDAPDFEGGDIGTQKSPRLSEGYTGSVKDVMSIVIAITGLLAVVLVFVFTFFTGMSCIVTETGIKIAESSDYGYILFHFFGKAYSTINASSLSGTAYSAARTLAIFGTIVSVGMILTMLAMTVLSVVKIARSLIYKAPCDVGKYVVTTFFLYVAFCLMLLCLVTRYTETDGVVTAVSLNGATYAGIICGAVLSAAYVAGRCVQRWKDIYARNGLAGIVIGVIALGLLIASMALLAGRTTVISHPEDSVSSTYKVGYIADYIYAEWPGETGLNYAIVAQFFTFVFLAAAGLACSGIVTKLTEEKSTGLLPYMLAALGAAAVVIAFGILEISESVFCWDSYTEGTFAPLIVGVSLYVVGFVLGSVLLRLSKKSGTSGSGTGSDSDNRFSEYGEAEDPV